MQIERLAIDEIDHAARRADGDVDSLLQLVELRPERPAADKHRRAEFMIGREAMTLVGHLLAQLTRGTQDQGLRPRLFRVDPLENRDHKGGCFSRSRAGLACAIVTAYAMGMKAAWMGLGA